jgi:hypothetical protein
MEIEGVMYVLLEFSLGKLGSVLVFVLVTSS